MAEYRIIPLTQNQQALVDVGDYEWLMQWKWCARWSKEGKAFYAIRGSTKGNINRTFLMHREILGLQAGDGLTGDHINHDPLDNRRSNLRVATPTENKRNRRTRADNKLGVTGVHYHKRLGKYRATICVDGKRHSLGCFAVLSDARKAYEEASVNLHGEFSCASCAVLVGREHEER